MEKFQTISLRSRTWLWILAWTLVVLVMAIPNPQILRVTFLFPLGLIRYPLALLDDFFPTETGSMMTPLVLSIVGWLFYVTLTILGLLQKTRTRFLWTYGVLCVLLILNIAGCHQSAPSSHQ